jgi:hypothetical protein
LTQMVMNRFAEAIQASRVDVVPRVVVGGGGSGTGGGATGSVMEGLLTMLLSEKIGESVGVAGERGADAEAMRQKIRDDMKGTDQRGADPARG